MNEKTTSAYLHRGKIKFDFHVSNKSRSKYQIEESLFSITGDLIIANFHQARIIASKINETRKGEGNFQHLTSAGQLNALGLIHEIFHYLIRIYEDNENPGVFSRGINYLYHNFGKQKLNEVLLQFTKEFSPPTVYNQEVSAEKYLELYTGGKSNKEIILEELLLLYLENSNPAATALEELYSNKPLIEKTDYQNFIQLTKHFFSIEKPFGKENLSLISFLTKPILESPYSIEGQLEFIREKWGVYISDKFLDRLLRGKDLIIENLRLFFQHGGGVKPTPPVPVYDYDQDYFNKLKAKLAAGKTLTASESQFYYSEVEKFTEDIDWMPKVVMLAKNSYVWLDQLSKKYKQHITRLDQIPDEELDKIAGWNFTALWLIGIWERSSASKKIKQLTGNPEAAPSAYSLFDYTIANDLGGEEAFQNLKHRAWQRGIRLASDMVPNHTGIYSKWVVEKPGYFIQSDYSPFPNYTFNSSNLSDDSRVEVRIEDKYYSREDAAVVFQRRDTHTGSIKYIYHGNDGTHMPWNDTAQLNLLNPEVRESLIQTILHVAKKFPIIRFDAAMTLAKKHYQRLWFPQPGTGGDIPSRSDYSMTREAFDAAMPKEFWREVVDRINSEMPSTLLLAEAFWMMEGYFVRTLGMHRVYNSAFMHMLMKEENNKYRELIKNTLDFNPEILKRYVNFMSNPDEETAVNQFGKGDKYFGVAVLMITLPGLPMFAHGQVEGFSEKYGMEYKRAYYDEHVDENLVRRHETEIFPLIKKRYLFSQVTNFELYDFIDDAGNVNENVFAYTNMKGSERTLVVYNNAYSQCKGYINFSAIKVAHGEANNNLKRNVKLISALNFNPSHLHFYICRDQKTGLEYLISAKEVNENGMYFALNGYEYKVLIDFKEIYDITGEYAKLHQSLKDEGAHSIDEKLKEIRLAPLHDSLLYLFSKETFEELDRACFDLIDKTTTSKENPGIIISKLTQERIIRAVNEIEDLTKIKINDEGSVKEIENDLIRTKHFHVLIEKRNGDKAKIKSNKLLDSLFDVSDSTHFHDKDILFTYFILSRVLNSSKSNLGWNKLFDDLLLQKTLVEIFKECGHSVENIFEEAALIKALISKEHLILKESLLPAGSESLFISELINNKEVSEYLLLNEFEGIIYYNKERLENIIDWLFVLSLIRKAPGKKSITVETSTSNQKVRKQKTTRIKQKDEEDFLLTGMEEILHSIDALKEKSDKSGYQLLKLKDHN
ncbi:MAG: alpha-amylase family glycosyl hydrolase [Ignavibacteriaceae bacterium]